jgi:hypothetical protein
LAGSGKTLSLERCQTPKVVKINVVLPAKAGQLNRVTCIASFKKEISLPQEMQQQSCYYSKKNQISFSKSNPDTQSV